MSKTDIEKRERAHHARRFWEMARSGQYNDDPCKIETNGRGEVVKEPPPSFSHKALQWRIQQLLSRVLPGVAITEFPVATRQGMKLPDVAWITSKTWNEAVADDLALPVPRLCVEVLSPSNTAAEMREKQRMYFEIGVEEVWVCDERGRIRVFTEQGEADSSGFVSDLPDRIDIRSS